MPAPLPPHLIDTPQETLAKLRRTSCYPYMRSEIRAANWLARLLVLGCLAASIVFRSSPQFALAGIAAAGAIFVGHRVWSEAIQMRIDTADALLRLLNEAEMKKLREWQEKSQPALDP